MNPCIAVNWDQQKDMTNTTTEDPEAILLPALEISS